MRNIRQKAWLNSSVFPKSAATSSRQPSASNGGETQRLANTIDELLMSAEYIMAGGNEKVILCERGIRTFETSTRNTLDISAIPVLKQKTHLPVIVDPSHAAGIRALVEPLSLAAVAAGADGLMIEVHNNPEKALCDGAQSLTPEMFDRLMVKINRAIDFFRILS